MYFYPVILNSYALYRDNLFNARFIKHETVKYRVSQLEKDQLFRVRKIGVSVQSREIYCISAGSGTNDILIWSQMHGDEPTATMAIFDILNFFRGNDDGQDDLRSLILDACTIHFIPMLNPDGAEVYQRRNSQGIDINRDFLALQTPEAQALMKIQQEIQPAFCFNMHDQHTLWSVSGSRKPASVSLLAPPVDDEASVTPARLKAMKLVASLFNMLKERIPGHIGRWSEEYEPRAVGETFQSLGSPTVLIEAGGYPDDPEKQFLRQINFGMFLHAFQQIALGTYEHEDISDYQNIPLNNKEIFHLLIRNCRVATPAGPIRADIGLNYEEDHSRKTQIPAQVYSVADFGDLSTWDAYKIIDADSAFIDGKIETEKPAVFRLEYGQGEKLVFNNGIPDFIFRKDQDTSENL